jgi:hypothetical protein
MTRRLLLLLLPLSLLGCGTRVFTHTVTITLDDPDSRLGPPPHEVSLFDAVMGQSEEWARRTIGRTAPDAPFTTTITTTDTVMVGESGPKPRIGGGLYLPALERQGYFAVSLTAEDGATQEVQAPFVPFFGFPADQPRPSPLAVRATATAGDDGWRLALVVRLPAEAQ